MRACRGLRDGDLGSPGESVLTEDRGQRTETGKSSKLSGGLGQMRSGTGCQRPRAQSRYFNQARHQNRFGSAEDKTNKIEKEATSAWV